VPLEKASFLWWCVLLDSTNPVSRTIDNINKMIDFMVVMTLVLSCFDDVFRERGGTVFGQLTGDRCKGEKLVI
jgi:branched-subunit amino acid transport protein AzlD